VVDLGRCCDTWEEGKSGIPARGNDVLVERRRHGEVSACCGGGDCLLGREDGSGPHEHAADDSCGYERLLSGGCAEGNLDARQPGTNEGSACRLDLPGVIECGHRDDSRGANTLDDRGDLGEVRLGQSSGGRLMSRPPGR